MPRFLTGRTGRIAAQAAVLTAVVGGTVAYTHSDSNRVTLVLDGVGRQVDTGERTVGALLASRGVTAGPRDLVAPAADSPIVNGETVVVRIARPFTVILDGHTTTYWTTALTVNDALAALGLHTQDALLSVARSQPLGRQGLALTVVTANRVTVTVDGRTRVFSTTAATVGALLTQFAITVRPLDRLSALEGSAVIDGETIVLTRIDRRQISAVEPLPFRTRRTDDADLTVGTTRVVAPGRPGTRSALYALVLTDGRITSRELVSTTALTAPVTQVVAVGTRPVPAPASTSRGSSTATTGAGSGAGLDWAALAQCESGGNPRAVNPSGYYGLYQFALSTWASVGGSGNPIDASAGEQLHRAQLLYARSGSGQWSCGWHLYQ